MDAAENDSNFNSLSMAVRAQKKILGKMASRSIAKHFVDEITARILDGFYRILKEYYSKKEAEKVIKNIIKMIIKLGVLYRNDKLTQQEVATLDEFEKKYRTLMLTVVSFRQVEFSYDRSVLLKRLQECQRLIQMVVKPHLSDKSTQRVNHIFQYTANADFLDSIFMKSSKFNFEVDQICADLNSLMEHGNQQTV